MTAEDDAEVFQELAAQLENEGSLSSSLPSDDVFPDIDPNVVPADVRAALEAILLVASDPVPPTVLAQLLEVGVETVDALCEYLTDSYAQEERGFTINRVAGGYRYQTSDAQAPYVERFVLEGRATRLSTAALETLAIVAYKQPISRAQIASIRGVNVDSVARTLQQRGYIEEVGRDPGPGNATMYGTTTLFLERYQTSDAQAPYVERFVLEGRATRLSTAALETLAIVAYKQPISRAQIASIRGVNVDSVARTLQQRGYIEEVGRDPGPGNATMYGTTTLFLERLGLDTVQDLPKLSDFVPEAEVVETLEVALRGVDETAEPSGTSDLSPPT